MPLRLCVSAVENGSVVFVVPSVLRFWELRRLLLSVLFFLTSSAAAGAILIVPFENRGRTAGLDWIGQSVVEALQEQLENAENYVVMREERAAVFDQLGIPPAFTLSHATIFKVAELTGADLVVLGHFEALPEKAGGRL